jgi:hypothetical protein
MIKDYVLHDIITANQGPRGRPHFFAVTIPQENMARYYPNLQMEGMTYRLLDTPGPDNLPRTDPQAVLQNMLGVYRLGSVMECDDAQRSQVYRSLAGLAGDGGRRGFGRDAGDLRASEFDSLARMIGKPRTDQYRVPNAVFLLGNYPAALNRAGYEFYVLATEAAATDQARYRELLASSLTAFRASLAVAPFNEQALEFFPLLLVQAYQDAEASAFLSSLQGNVPVEMEERTVFNAIRGFVRGGVPELAITWLGERLAAQPERKFYYQVLFSVHQAVGDVSQARAVMEAWQRQSGEQDADMARGLEEMRSQAGSREQEQVRQQVEEALGR